MIAYMDTPRGAYPWGKPFIPFSDRFDHGHGIDRMFDESVYQTEEVKPLTTIPGIGSLTAVQMMSMIVSIDCFQTVDKMRAYFGMAPSVRDSGGKEKHSHITRKVDSMMRSILGRTLNQFIMYAKDSSVMMYYVPMWIPQVRISLR